MGSTTRSRTSQRGRPATPVPQRISVMRADLPERVYAIIRRLPRRGGRDPELRNGTPLRGIGDRLPGTTYDWAGAASRRDGEPRDGSG